jgi:hypothetical protein
MNTLQKKKMFPGMADFGPQTSQQMNFEKFCQ